MRSNLPVDSLRRLLAGSPRIFPWIMILGEESDWMISGGNMRTPICQCESVCLLVHAASWCLSVHEGLSTLSVFSACLTTQPIWHCKSVNSDCMTARICEDSLSDSMRQYSLLTVQLNFLNAACLFENHMDYQWTYHNDAWTCKPFCASCKTKQVSFRVVSSNPSLLLCSHHHTVY